jgi:tetratricopeptide (TPR) repeat protein
MARSVNRAWRNAGPLLPLLAALAGCAGGAAATHKGAAGDGEDLIQVREAAEAAYAAKDYAESEKHYTLLARRVPLEADNWFRLGNIYARTARPEAALAAYREALVRDPEHRKAWYNLGILQLRAAAASLEQLQNLPGADDAMTRRSREILEQLRATMQGESGGDSAAEPAAEPDADPAAPRQ